MPRRLPLDKPPVSSAAGRPNLITMTPTTFSIVPPSQTLDRSRALPAEVWLMIFKHVTHATFDMIRIDNELNALLRVCSFWRAMLLSQPTFWVDINILQSPRGAPLPLVRRWLAYSQPAPISWTLHGFQHYQTLSQYIALAVSQAYRWKGIDLQEMEDPDELESLCKLNVGSVTMLESAQIDIYHWPKELQVRVWNVIGSSPMLRSVAPTTFLADLPWQQLTHLETYPGEQLGIFFEALSKCKNLESLRLRRFDAGGSSFSKPIVLPCLEQLAMRATHHTGPLQILKHLIVPKLNWLEVSGGTFLSLEHFLAIDEFVSTSTSKLRELRLYSGHHTISPMSMLWSPSFAHLEVLLLRDAPVEILHALTIQDEPSSESTTLFPCLSSLSLKLSHQEIEEGLIGLMVLSRLCTGSLLKQVRIWVAEQTTGNSFERDKEMFATLRKSGVDVEFNQ